MGFYNICFIASWLSNSINSVFILVAHGKYMSHQPHKIEILDILLSSDTVANYLISALHFLVTRGLSYWLLLVKQHWF